MQEFVYVVTLDQAGLDQCILIETKSFRDARMVFEEEAVKSITYGRKAKLQWWICHPGDEGTMQVFRRALFDRGHDKKDVLW